MQHVGLCNGVDLVVEDDRGRLGFGKEVKNGCERGKRVLGSERKKRLVEEEERESWVWKGRRGWL